MILNLECFTNIFNFSLHFSKQTNEQNLEIITLCSSCLGETDLEEISNPCQKAFFSNNECSLIFSIKLSVQCMHLLFCCIFMILRLNWLLSTVTTLWFFLHKRSFILLQFAPVQPFIEQNCKHLPSSGGCSKINWDCLYKSINCYIHSKEYAQ